MKNKKIITGAMALLLATGTSLTAHAEEDFSIDPDIDKKILDKIGTDEVVEYNPEESPIERDARLAELDSKKASALAEISSLQNLSKEDKAGFTSRVKSADKEKTINSILAEARTLNEKKAPKPEPENTPEEKQNTEEDTTNTETEEKETPEEKVNDDFFTMKFEGKDIKIYGFDLSKVKTVGKFGSNIYVRDTNDNLHTLVKAPEFGEDAYKPEGETPTDTDNTQPDLNVDEDTKPETEDTTDNEETQPDTNDEEDQTEDEQTNEEETPSDVDKEDDDKEKIDKEQSEQEPTPSDEEKDDETKKQQVGEKGNTTQVVTTSPKVVQQKTTRPQYKSTSTVKTASSNPKTGVVGSMAVAEILSLASASYILNKKRK